MGRIRRTALVMKAACTPGACAPGASVHVKNRKPVVAAVVSNITVGIVKFIAAFISGSSAMIAEGIHSVVDSANAGILLYGMRRSKRKADDKHPFGYSRELYFWTLIVGIVLFTLGGGLSVYEGISRIRGIGPESTIGNPWLNYVILGVSMAIEGYALSVAMRSFNRDRKGVGPVRYLRQARDPSLFAVLLENLSDELSLALAFAATLIAHATGNLYADAIASILIGALLCTMAFTLLHETKELLIGRGMTPEDLAEVTRIVNAHVDVLDCSRALSLYLGPHDLLLTIEATFDDDATVSGMARSIYDIEGAIIARFPQVKRIFIEPQPS